MECGYYTYILICITIVIISDAVSTRAAAQSSDSHYRFCNAPKDKPHISSYPYISGDTFRSYATFIIEDDDDSFDTTALQLGDIIFVQTDYLKHFFTDIHPTITTPYILITHNSDDPAPGPYLKHLDDTRIIAWFGQNPSITNHPKFIPIPIGIANKSFEYGDTAILEAAINESPRSKARSCEHLLYMNFTINTNVLERKKAYEAFINAPFCTYAPRLPYASYIQDLTRFMYVVSPEGNGLDCYRTWEAMLLGCIPIVKHSALDPLFEGLPVLLINNWDQVTQEFLEKKYRKLQKKTYNLNKLHADYWINQIRAVQNKIRKK